MDCKVLGHIRSGERTKSAEVLQRCREARPRSSSRARAGFGRWAGRGGGGGFGDVKWGQAFGTWPGGLGPPFWSFHTQFRTTWVVLLHTTNDNQTNISLKYLIHFHLFLEYYNIITKLFNHIIFPWEHLLSLKSNSK
jgi:hypothetical protein